jgi:hypothetical protein
MKSDPNVQKYTPAILLILSIISCLAFPTPVLAANSLVIDTMRIDIWPEYDKPSVLVIYHITLSPNVTLPAAMSFRIPASVGVPHAVAMQDPNGLYNLNYDMATAGEWEEIHFITPVPEVRIEYYDPGLSKKGTTRNFTYTYAGDYTVNNLSLTVQQPAGALNMTLKPDMGSGAQAEDGLTYFSYIAGKIEVGTTFSISISYEKSSDILPSTGQYQPVQPDEPINESIAGQINWEQVLPWTLGGLVLLLIAAGIFYYFGPRRALQAASQYRASSKISSGETRPEGGFCPQWGKRAAAGDIYCRACGTKLR